MEETIPSIPLGIVSESICNCCHQLREFYATTADYFSDYFLIIIAMGLILSS